MTSQRAFGIALIGIAIALFLFVAIAGSRASAENGGFTASLHDSGYTWERVGNVSYGGLSIPGTLINVSDPGRGFVQVQLFEYESREKLLQEWAISPASDARPLTAYMDLASRPAYWNGNSVLVVGMTPPYNHDLAVDVGRLFLSQGVPSAEIVQPPSTGDAGLVVQGQRPLPVWAGLIWAGLSIVALGFAGVGGVAIVKAIRS